MDFPKLRGPPWAGRGREVPRWSREGFRKGEAYLQHCPNVGAIVREKDFRNNEERRETERTTYETKREANQRTRHVFQKKENLKAAPLPPSLDGAGQNQAPRGPQ